MDRQVADHSELRFAAYVLALTSVMGHAHRSAALKDYCVGLLAAERRKSVEPIAAVTAPAKVSAQHQKLLHFVANGAWSDKQVLAKVREFVLPTIERYGPIEAGQSMLVCVRKKLPLAGVIFRGLGKQANCQVVVTLSLANREHSDRRHVREASETQPAARSPEFHIRRPSVAMARGIQRPAWGYGFRAPPAGRQKPTCRRPRHE